MSTPRRGRALVPLGLAPPLLCCVDCGGLVAISFVSYKCNIWEMKAVINACLLS